MLGILAMALILVLALCPLPFLLTVSPPGPGHGGGREGPELCPAHCCSLAFQSPPFSLPKAPKEAKALAPPPRPPPPAASSTVGGRGAGASS